MIADTDFLISLIQRDADAVRKTKELESENVPIKIPAMAVLELYIGVGAELTDDEERRVRRIIEAHPVVEMDREVAMRAGRRLGERGSGEFRRHKGDAAIGATADIADEPVLTRNVDDFESLGFEVEEY